MPNSRELKRASQQLTENYRNYQGLKSLEEREAYLAVRLPMTSAAILAVFKELEPVQSILDIGAGPGTVARLFPHLKVTCVEKDPFFIEMGKGFGDRWIEEDARMIPSFDPHDLVVFAYSLGEFDDDLTKYWKAARKGIVIIEPGTPRGFQNMLKAREQLISLGGYVAAPCPHSRECPLSTMPNEWCHFAVRVERSQLHRQIKEGTLSYEDEKYSYVVVMKEATTPCTARLLHEPQRRKGHVHLQLCTADRIEHKTISRRHGHLYKKARKFKWGERIDEQLEPVSKNTNSEK